MVLTGRKLSSGKGRLLIPSVNFSDISSIRRFSRYFGKVELDLYGLDTKLPESDVRQLHACKTALEEGGLAVHVAHLRRFDLSKKCKPAKLEAAIAYCNAIAGLFGPEVAVLHGGFGSMDRLLKNAGHLLENTPPSLSLAIENMTPDSQVLHSPGTIKSFIEKGANLAPRLGICIDTTHPQFPLPGNGDSYTALLIDYLEASLPMLLHLHFSDRSPTCERGKHLPIGDGMINWETIDSFLLSHGYGGHAAIEIRFVEGLAEQTILSACRYYGCKQTDLKIGLKENAMAGELSGRSEFLSMLGRLPSFSEAPQKISEMLMLPENAMIEKTDEYVYFIVPSPSYHEGHVDPFSVLHGEAVDDFDWARYIFGMRYHGMHLSALLIDKKRKIAVCESVLDIHPGQTMDWTRFGTAMAKALEASTAKSRNPEIVIDHVMVTPYGGTQYIRTTEELAWGQEAGED